MRLSLGNPIDDQRAAAVRRVTKLARQAHQQHEDQGGFTAEHATHLFQQGESTPASRLSLDTHLAIQDARQRAIRQIQAAPHGNAIGEIVGRFEKSFGA